jgi:hypothetical protein
MVRIPIGDASNGLCGGMALAARDYFEAGRRPPAQRTPPRSGRLFDYLVDRLFDSFDLPFGPARYLELMNPALPDTEPILRWLGLGSHGRAWRMIREEWPKIQDDLDDGRLSPLGLVLVKSMNPFDLKFNHQVLAYGYKQSGEHLAIRLYDPNEPDLDDVLLTLRGNDPRRAAMATLSPPGSRVHAFFRVGYQPAVPP